MKDSEPDNHLTEEVYTKSRLALKIIIPLVIIIPFIGFLLNFPLNSILTNLISKNLAALQSCPISFEKVDTSLFLIPKITIKNPTIAGVCYKMPGQDLKLNDIVVSFRGPSFYPPGLKFHAQVGKDKSIINIYSSVSYNKVILKIEDSKVDSDLIDNFISKKGFVKGQFGIEALVDMSFNAVNEANILLTSKNVVVPGRNMDGFILPTLNIGSILLKGTMNSQGRIIIHDLLAGGQNSPINAKFDGDITSNNFNFTFSNINLKGEVSFSKEILENFSILSLLLSNYKIKNGFYQMQIGGTLEAPQMMPQ